MSALSIQPTYPIFTDIDGQPLDDGYIFIGVANLQPIGNPINVYWDAALTIPAAQPIRTISGYPANAGTPARLYVNSDYSIQVQNKNGTLVYSAPTATERYSGVVVNISAADVDFTQAGAGAVLRNVQEKLEEFISAEDFGADPTGVSDATAQLQAACDAAAGKTLLLEPNATYRCTDQIHMKGDVDGQGAMLMFYGAAISYLVYQDSMGSLRNFTIDGDNVSSCQAGLQVDTDFVFTGYCNYDLTIKNISNNNNTQPCSGAQFFKGSGATNLNSYLDIRLQVKNVVATANGIPGDSGGKASGIIVGFNAAGTNGNVVIHDCNVETVSSGGVDPYEDSDGIHLLIAGHTTSKLGLYEIRDCVTKDCKKRGYKIQSQNTLVTNCICYGQDTKAGFETYGLNATYFNCKHLLGTEVAFSTDFLNTKFIGCYAEGSGATVDLVRVYSNADYATFENCTFVSSAAYPTGDFGVMRIYEADNVSLIKTNLRHTLGNGCSLLLREPAIVFIESCLFEGSGNGINFWQSTGRLTISDSVISANGPCMSRADNTIQAIFARDCRFNSGTSLVIDLWNSAGANSAFAEFDNCRMLNSGSGSVQLAPNSRIFNCLVANLGAQTGTGIFMAGSDGVVRNCQINNFSTGVLVTSGADQEIADNVTVGCTTGYNLAGGTPLVNTDNFSR
jgi:hypothetical protein